VEYTCPNFLARKPYATRVYALKYVVNALIITSWFFLLENRRMNHCIVEAPLVRFSEFIIRSSPPWKGNVKQPKLPFSKSSRIKILQRFQALLAVDYEMPSVIRLSIEKDAWNRKAIEQGFDKPGCLFL